MTPRSYVDAALRRGSAWADRQDPASWRGVTIAAARSYREIDGPLQSLLLTTYIVIAVVPALLVMEEYLDTNAAALADRLVRHYDLSTQTAGLVRSVLVQTRVHEIGSALLAVAGALAFGLGFGHVLQLVHVRAWELVLTPRRSDQARFAAVLLVLYGLVLLGLLEVDTLGRGVSLQLALAVQWLVLLTLYFAWAARLLTHRLVSRRDALAAAAVTGCCLVALIVASKVVFEQWVNLYARDYGGLGVVMAVFFWIGLGSTVVVLVASASPALASRRAACRQRSPDAARGSSEHDDAAAPRGT